MKTFSLQPINGRKSFNGKCHVNQYTNENGDVCSDLISYNTTVASYNHNTNKMSVNGWYSATTKTHIDAFFHLYGFELYKKAELMKQFSLTK